MDGLTRKYKKNITNREEQAMKDLMDDESIIIRPSDKGS